MIPVIHNHRCPQCRGIFVLPLPYKSYSAYPLFCQECGFRYIVVLSECMPVPIEYRDFPRYIEGSCDKEDKKEKSRQSNKEKEEGKEERDKVSSYI